MVITAAAKTKTEQTRTTAMKVLPESTEGWSTLFQILTIALIAGTVITGLLALYFSNKAGRQQAERMVTLEKETAQARTKQAEAERALLELQERTTPRGLSDVSLANLRKYLAFVPRTKKLRVEIVRARHKFPITETSEVYAEQLSRVLKGEGFNVSIVEVPDSEVPRTGLFLNAYFGFKENTGAPSQSESLVGAINGTLTEAGLVVQTPKFEPDVRYKDEELVKIIIGLEP
jgi:hypothetical protein